MSMECFDCVRIPNITPRALTDLKEELSEKSLLAMVPEVKKRLFAILVNSGWKNDTVFVRDLALLICQMAAIRRVSILRNWSECDFRVLQRMALDYESTNSGVSEAVMKMFPHNSMDFDNPVYALVEMVSLGCSLVFIPVKNSGDVFLKGFGIPTQVMDELRDKYEAYEFHTGTDGDYAPSCPDCLLEFLTDNFEENDVEKARYYIGAYFADERRNLVQDSIGSGTWSSNGLNIQLMDGGYRETLRLFRLAIMESVAAEKTEFHIWLEKPTEDSAPGLCAGYKETKSAIGNLEPVIHSTILSLCTTALFDFGYRIFLHCNDSNQTEIKLGVNEGTDRFIRMGNNLPKLIASGEFGQI